jgi:two-component system, LuxR family, sensor kinase FixL
MSPLPAQSWLEKSAGALSLQARSYWLTGCAFIVIYIVVEKLSLVYKLDGLGITLWGPSAGLSLVLLLTRGLSFAPFIFLASLIADFAVYLGPRGLVAPTATSAVLAVGLSVLAWTLQRVSNFGRGRAGLADVVALLLVVLVGNLVIAFLYCGALYSTGLLAPSRFILAVRNFWIGDTVGMITLVPAVPTLLWMLSAAVRTPSRGRVFDAVIFLVAVFAALWVIFGVANAQEYQFFYLLFLPIVLVAIRAGYAGVSVALLLTHVLLVALATAQGYAAYDFIAFQMLMLVLSATGLLLGAVVSERARSEERARKQQEELARATRHATVGAMGTALAHEISQPMSSATNYLHAARRMLRASGDVTSPVAEALAKAETEARRAREALERVRDYVSTGRLDLSDVDLEALVGKIASLARRHSRGVTVDVTSKPHLPTLQGDAIQLEQLLVNLVSNAIDAACSRGDGKGRVTVHLRQHVERIAIAIEDNGPGVPNQIANRLFEPFETTKPRGMGLGLTLARQIVESHGGLLRWERLQPQGTCFLVELRIDGPTRDTT